MRCAAVLLLAAGVLSQHRNSQSCDARKCSSDGCYAVGQRSNVISGPPYAGQTETINAARVLFHSGHISSDTLGLDPADATTHGVTTSWDPGTGILSISGSNTVETYGEIIAKVYVLSSDTSGVTKQVTWNLGSAVFDTTNGHFYEYFDQAAISWTDAQAACQANSQFGYVGYLATITDADENNFATQKLQGDGWIGASDSASEGQWRWVTGCEGEADGGNGMLFWTGNSPTGVPVGSAYSNWATGEPNDSPAEDYGHIYASGVNPGKWNDFFRLNPAIRGYVCEWGGSCPSAGSPRLPPAGVVQVTACQAPSTSPTAAPSRSPSAPPSTEPTHRPSVPPPTVSPSRQPSTTPSLSPSSTPTLSPSGSPTSTPTASPSASPSKAPSASPTTAPTPGPSTTPSASPLTSAPSAAPSRSPTRAPTLHPCDDGSHGCGNSTGATCTRVNDSAEFLCGCAETFVCLANCGSSDSVRCIAATPAPPSSEDTWPFFLLAAAALCCLPCLLAMLLYRKKQRQKEEPDAGLGRRDSGAGMLGGAATRGVEDEQAGLPADPDAVLWSPRGAEIAAAGRRSPASGYDCEYRPRLSPPRSPLQRLPDDGAAEVVAAPAPQRQLDGVVPPSQWTSAAQAAQEVVRLKKEVAELEALASARHSAATLIDFDAEAADARALRLTPPRSALAALPTDNADAA